MGAHHYGSADVSPEMDNEMSGTLLHQMNTRNTITSELDVVNPLVHTSQIKGCSPEWVRLCEISSPLLTKFDEHFPHLNGLLWLCRIRCCLRFELCVNPFGQMEHKYGLSPLNIYRKKSKFNSIVFWWAKLQIKSYVWILKWSFNDEVIVNAGIEMTFVEWVNRR